MTRITNLGRKRTFLEAGFAKRDEEEMPQAEYNGGPVSTADEVLRTKKPRKRRRKTKAGTEGEPIVASVEAVATKNIVKRPDYEGDHLMSKEMRKEGKRTKRPEEKAAASERRRQRRIMDRHAHTTCLACRKQGHTVKNCPTTASLGDDEGTGVSESHVVGICYRCGSTRHNLSRCKKVVDPKEALPFASCFVCSGRGHLASSCPKNEGRGIYPHGGSCKLCGQTSHLAKDCELRTQEQALKNNVMLGGKLTDRGADEDDFHVLGRRRDALQKEEKLLQKIAQNTIVAKPKPKVVMFR